MSKDALSVKSFPERLAAAIQAKGGPVVVGLDPRPELFPDDVLAEGRRMHDDPRQAVSAAVTEFNRRIIDAICDVAVAVKPQLAFYEQLGWPGMRALEETIDYAKRLGLLVIADGKRNDIGSTAAAYSRAYLGAGGQGDENKGDAGGGGAYTGLESGLEADALTINPYFGSDGVAPFLEACRERGKGLFVLVRTSNPSGAELQHLPVGVHFTEQFVLPPKGTTAANRESHDKTDGAAGGAAGGAVGGAADGAADGAAEGADQEQDTVAHRVADLVVRWNEGMPTYDGFGPVGAVVGATVPRQAMSLRRRMPGVMFLVPGYGAQGAGAADAKAAFDHRGKGALVNSARGVLYAWRLENPGESGTMADYAEAARRAARRMRDELAAVLD